MRGKAKSNQATQGGRRREKWPDQAGVVKEARQGSITT